MGLDACDADDAAARADASQEILERASDARARTPAGGSCATTLSVDGRGRRCHQRALQALPLLTAYRNLGFDIADFPNALAQFENEITPAASYQALR